MSLRVARVAGCIATLVTAAVVGALAVQRRSFATTLPGLQHTEMNSQPAGQLVLEGDIPIENGLIQYLGGFCFARTRHGLAGRLISKFKHAADDPRFHAGRYVMIAFLDDQPQHWPAALENWNILSCQSLKAFSNYMKPVASESAGGGYTVHFSIREKFAARHWHVIVAACATGLDQEPAWGAAGTAASSNASRKFFETSFPLTYTLTGVGALSSWGPQQQEPSVCENGWRHAGEELWHYMVS